MASKRVITEDLLKEELKTYEAHRKSLTEKAEGKFVLIHKKDIVGIFETEGIAVGEGYRQFDEGAFLVRQISKVEIPLNFTSYALGV